MHFNLVVINPFAGHEAGDLITDPDLVEQLSQTHADRVVRVPVAKAANPGKED